MKPKHILMLGCALLLNSLSIISTFASSKTTTKATSTQHPIQTLRGEWIDNSRQRKVPYKIYYASVLKTPVPVIIFSHGLGGSRDNYEYLGKGWAAHGFVSVHLQHAGSDSEIWQNNGIQNKAELMRVFSKAANARNAANRAQDVSFALDQLEKMNQNGVLKGHLDLARVGMAGHSFGANTTLMVSGQKMGRFAPSMLDSRIKAAIPMSSPAPRDRSNLGAVYGGIKIPMFHMTGTKDTSPIGNDGPAERLLPYQNIAAENQYLLVLSGGDHMVFSGRRRSNDPTQAAQDKLFQSLILQSSVAFWNAYLKSEPKALNWLNNDFKIALGKNGTFEHR